MLKRFDARLEKLERGRGDEVYVILFGDECERYDAALAAGDEYGAFDVLRGSNPSVSDEVLWQTVRERGSWLDLSPRPYQPSTLIRAEYEETR